MFSIQDTYTLTYNRETKSKKFQFYILPDLKSVLFNAC